MKRRDFIAKGSAGALTVGTLGCSNLKNNYRAPEHNKVKVPKGTLGSTDIIVSKFGFGSHLNEK